MSFVGYKDVIEEGDTAILYLSASSLYAIEVNCTIKNKHGELVENVFQTTYGALRFILIFFLINFNYIF